MVPYYIHKTQNSTVGLSFYIGPLGSRDVRANERTNGYPIQRADACKSFCWPRRYIWAVRNRYPMPW